MAQISTEVNWIRPEVQTSTEARNYLRVQISIKARIWLLPEVQLSTKARNWLPSTNAAKSLPLRDQSSIFLTKARILRAILILQSRKPRMLHHRNLDRGFYRRQRRIERQQALWS